MTSNQRLAADALDDHTDQALGRIAAHLGRVPLDSVADLDLLATRLDAESHVLLVAVAWRRAEPGPTSAWEGHANHTLMSAVDRLIALQGPGVPDTPRVGEIGVPAPTQRPGAASASDVPTAEVADVVN
jgi:hypothetical protein